MDHHGQVIRTRLPALIVAVGLIACGSNSGSELAETTILPTERRIIDSTPTHTDPTDTVRPETAAPEGTAPFATAATVPAIHELSIESGFTARTDTNTGLQVTAAAVVTNAIPNGDACDVKVAFTFTDSGTLWERQTERLAWIPTGTERYVVPKLLGARFSTEPTAMTVTISVSAYTIAPEIYCGINTALAGVTFPVHGAHIGDSLQSINGQVTNTTDAPVETSQIRCVEYAGDTIVGGESSAILDTIAAGATIPVDVPSKFIPAAADSAVCQVVA